MKYIYISFVLFCFLLSSAFAWKNDTLKDGLWKKQKLVTEIESSPKLDVIKEKLKEKLQKKFDKIDGLPAKKRKAFYNAFLLKITSMIQDENTPKKNKPVLRLLKQIIKEKKDNLK